MELVKVGPREYYVENGIYTPVIKESSYEKEGGTYRLEGNYLIPNLELIIKEERPLGKYGRIRQTYLKEHNKSLYNSLSIQGKLMTHLADINEQANTRLDTMMKQMMETYGITEELKANDQMKWIREVNNIRAMCEEVIYKEMIYV
ncbi:TnpV protein [Caldibacillus thermoamylovorans]|uniref:TnpV protein n=1 Tax=Caldibacillus thermoamylovorans TaxID=35841 RepID=UPI0009E550F9